LSSTGTPLSRISTPASASNWLKYTNVSGVGMMPIAA
jgi:hypothetical protein